jgi:hypothetical protein
MISVYNFNMYIKVTAHKGFFQIPLSALYMCVFVIKTCCNIWCHFLPFAMQRYSNYTSFLAKSKQQTFVYNVCLLHNYSNYFNYVYCLVHVVYDYSSRCGAFIVFHSKHFFLLLIFVTLKGHYLPKSSIFVTHKYYQI